MKSFDNDKVHNKLINRLDRQEKQQAFQQDRFFKFKLTEIHAGLSQALIMEKIIETDNAAAVSDSLLKGLKQMLKTNEFDFKYFIAPIRQLVPRPNIFSLYITQYILEIIMNDPHVIDIYGADEDIYKVVNNGADEDIYKVVNRVISNINMKFEKTEEKIVDQLSRNKSLVPGSRDYDIALDQLFRKAMGEPQGNNPQH
ncbi:MAG: hypothetical protein JRJ23_08165 [Deltaproteobacteria bacterium]|nr:hypothetical protein [Deltaproteobacteria bacterium]